MTDASYRESLARIATSAEQLGKQIEDLLTIALDDAEMLVLKDDGGTGARAQAGDCQVATLASLRQVRLEPDVKTQTPSWRRTPDRQIMSVLLDNAIRYSHPGGTVDISPRYLWQLEVRDYGIGSRGGPATNIRARFPRKLGAAALRDGRASACRCKAFAERHGGALSLDSTSKGDNCPPALPNLEAA